MKPTDIDIANFIKETEFLTEDKNEAARIKKKWESDPVKARQVLKKKGLEEEFIPEIIEELTRRTLQNYITKARADNDKRRKTFTSGDIAKNLNKINRRHDGISTAYKKKHNWRVKVPANQNISEARRIWSGMPGGAASVARGTHAHFVEKHGREPSREELTAKLKKRAQSDAVGWHQKHAAIAHKILTNEEALGSEVIEELTRRTLQNYINKARADDNPAKKAKRAVGEKIAIRKVIDKIVTREPVDRNAKV